MQDKIDLIDFKAFSNFEKRFLSLMPENSFNDYDSCWLWQGKLETTGYGRIVCGNKRYGVHQLAYMIFNGDIPQGKIVRHTCDNKNCMNPKHLVLGNHQDNALDLMQRKSPIFAQLNEEAVKVIKWMLKYKNHHGLSRKLASVYNVHFTTISDIKRNKTWYWVNV